MKKILSLAAATALALTGLSLTAPTAAHAACTTIVYGNMAPTAVVVGTEKLKNSTFTLRATSCDEVNYAYAEFRRYNTLFDDITLDEIGHSGDTFWYGGVKQWDPYELYNIDAGTWKSKVTFYGDQTLTRYTSDFYLQRAAALTTNATPEPIKKGRTLTIGGTLKRANWDTMVYGGYASQTVALQYRPKASNVYTNVKNVTSDSKGNLKTTVKAGADGYYRYQYTANPTSTSEATSVGDYVDVN